MHEHPSGAWSRGLSFVNEVAEKGGVFKTKQCRERIMVRVELRVHHRVLQQRRPGQESHEELCGCCIEGPEEREIDSVKAIGSMDVGVTCEEPNVLDHDEYAEELQNVFDSIN